MKNKTVWIVMGLWVVMVCFDGTSAFAKGRGNSGSGDAGGGMPAGFSKGQKKGWGDEKTPPGWSQGKKKGWRESGGPLGLFKKKSQEKESAAQPPAQS